MGICLKFACLSVGRVLVFWDLKVAMPEIKKILFITLSNIGDVILTLPVLDYLKGAFSRKQDYGNGRPEAKRVHCRSKTAEGMKLIRVEDVVDAAESILRP